MKKLFCLMAATALLLTGCQGTDGETPDNTPVRTSEIYEFYREDSNLIQMQKAPSGSEVAKIVTSMGDIEVMFFPEQAPKAVENFITHAKDGYYNGVKFHRIIKDFMIQGGDPTGTGAGGASIWGGYFEDEFSFDLWNFRGALSMANTGSSGTNSSQFFIVQAPSVGEDFLGQMAAAGWFPEEVINLYAEIGGTPWLDQRHTVFGQVISGMDVVDAIANVAITGEGTPVEDVIIAEIQFYTVP